MSGDRYHVPLSPLSPEPNPARRLGKAIPPSQGKSPFSLDSYLSWMSTKLPVHETSTKCASRLFECIGMGRVTGSPRDYTAGIDCSKQATQKSRLGEPH